MHVATIWCPKGILGQGGKAFEAELEDMNFNFPMAYVMYHNIFQIRIPTVIQKHNSMIFPWFSMINNVISMTF